MTYTIKEIFYTLQGEGAHAGRPAVFLRFSGCNLWSGLENDRSTAICKFCDTDFVGTGPDGGKFKSPEQLADVVDSKWAGESMSLKYVVCTGGEPLLQLDEPLIHALKRRGFMVAVETNGTVAVPRGIDWLCVSPKIGSDLKVHEADEIKLVYPQIGGDPRSFETIKAKRYTLQPCDDSNREANLAAAIAYCKENPLWHFGIQIHKLIGIR